MRSSHFLICLVVVFLLGYVCIQKRSQHESWLSKTLGSLACYSFGTKYETRLLQSLQDFKAFNSQLTDFEKRLGTFYPLGSDSFRISHGQNYSSFFRDIGKPECILAFLKGQIIGTCFVVRRTFPISCWYLADLKVDRAHRNMGLVAFLYQKYNSKFTKEEQCGFGVTMNGGSSSPKMKRIAQALGCQSTPYHIYLLNDQKMQELLQNNILSVAKLVSLHNKKDLILKSTQKPLPLLHVIPTSPYYPMTRAISCKKGYWYMFGCVEGSNLFCKLQSANVSSFGSATIYSKAMNHLDFSFLNTCEI
jgi:hypothetical protein